ncbi:MAG: isoprenylcysteine carboxylmethyltransferase family protein [Paracoccaceae bacterium]|nr:isoprenylcysteine carboxylmethyltransferase family protein [Paracoccaceae bacterium]
MTPRKMIDLPPLWLALFAALAWAQARLLPFGGFGGWGGPLGTALIVGGLALLAVAVVEFRRHRTTLNPHGEASALISTGIYRFSRNPIYLADALILSGLSLLWGALAGLVLVPAFMALIAARFIRPEEDRLRAAFGAAFEAWAARTRRWL